MELNTHVLLTEIRPSRWQPRTSFDADALWELAQSIERVGLINPIVVFAEDDHYELVAGERRVRAEAALSWAAWDDDITPKAAIARLADEGLDGLPQDIRARFEEVRMKIAARVLPPPGGEEDLARLHWMVVVENLERKSLDPLEEARALQGLIQEHGWSQRELARAIGKSQTFVAQRLALLDLGEAAREAVSARALTATHARAIARVPEPLQPAVTEWALKAAGREDTPATTRQVQNRARQVTAFVDPQRWAPQTDQVYRPVERNWLALMRWAIERATSEGRLDGQELLRLAAVGYDNRNLLARKPLKLVQNRQDLLRALQALGYDGGLDETWRRFALDTRRTCDRCIFGNIDLEVGMVAAYCPRWGDVPPIRGEADRREEGPRQTCDKFIGPFDPVVIPWRFGRSDVIPDRQEFMSRLGVPFADQPFPHVTSAEGYVRAHRAALEAREAHQAAREEEQQRQYLRAIEEYFDWCCKAPAEWLSHFQAHGCGKCAHYRADLLGRGMPPCEFAAEPLHQSWGIDKSMPRAPQFSALVTEDGLLLPRCEQFAYRRLPALKGVVVADRMGLKFGQGSRAAEGRARVMNWLLAIGRNWRSVYIYGVTPLWGILRWLDYGRPAAKNDVKRLTAWILSEWDELGGDEVVATLIDVAISEAATGFSRSGTIQLFNGITGAVETFVPLNWSYVIWAEGEPYGYPEGWPKPWIEEKEPVEF